MKTYEFTIIMERDKNGYHAFAPALPGCHSFGPTLEKARKNVEQAIQLHVECMREDGEEIPIEKEPVFLTRLTIPIPA